jgi:hypothetical protein
VKISFKVLLFLCCLIVISPLEAKHRRQNYLHKHHLSACMIFNNEAPYLKEWLEYHLLLGVQHFYLYNNQSTDNYREVLQPYLDKNIVELVNWNHTSHNLKEWDKSQVAAYNHCLRRARGQTKWLAIIDSDEFIVPVTTDNLSAFLKPYETKEKVGGILVNWVVYGTSHVAKIPENCLLIEKLVMSSITGSNHAKTICMVDCVSHVMSPHYMLYKSGWRHCTPSGHFGTGIEIDKIRINHYWARDEWYLENVKIPRRRVWGTDAAECRRWAEANNGAHDTSIFRFIEPLRKRMQQ